jgi:hypothetical protein
VLPLRETAPRYARVRMSAAPARLRAPLAPSERARSSSSGPRQKLEPPSIPPGPHFDASFHFSKCSSLQPPEPLKLGYAAESPKNPSNIERDVLELDLP